MYIKRREDTFEDPERTKSERDSGQFVHNEGMLSVKDIPTLSMVCQGSSASIRRKKSYWSSLLVIMFATRQ